MNEHLGNSIYLMETKLLEKVLGLSDSTAQPET
jgi:hypothetical protein